MPDMDTIRAVLRVIRDDPGLIDDLDALTDADTAARNATRADSPSATSHWASADDLTDRLATYLHQRATHLETTT